MSRHGKRRRRDAKAFIASCGAITSKEARSARDRLRDFGCRGRRRQLILRRRGGFALLMAVVLIAMAGLLLAGLARRGLSTALHAADAHEELRLRWGTQSLERALPHQVESLLARTLDVQQVRPPLGLPMQTEVVVGTTRYQIRMDDESAKLNLNRVLAAGGANGLQRGLAQLGLGDVAAYLPTYQLYGNGGMASWGQVFPLDSIPRKQDPPAWIAGRTQHITLWGDGKLNVNRAPDLVLEAICRDVIGPVATNKLLALRGERPDVNAKGLLDELALKSQDRNRLLQWLGDTSTCFTLWITVTTPRRQETRLVIVGRLGEPLSRFRW